MTPGRDVASRTAARSLCDGTLKPEEFVAWLTDDACRALRDLLMDRVGPSQKTIDALATVAQRPEVPAPDYTTCAEHQERHRADRLCSRCVREDVRLSMGGNWGT